VRTELSIFARFHGRPGNEAAVASALQDVIAPTRAEPGCRSAEAYQSVRDPQLFFIHSRWSEETAFETHATLPHTKRFIERVQALIDHPLDVNRTRPLAPSKKGRTTRIGFMDGAFKVPDDFDTMAEEIEEMFYGDPDK
jgi:quinol monooxygenase YgiN